MLLQGIDDTVDKQNTVLKRSMYENIKRQNEINSKVLKGTHTSDELVELGMIKRKHKKKF